jgi:hypothetical protein
MRPQKGRRRRRRAGREAEKKNRTVNRGRGSYEKVADRRRRLPGDEAPRGKRRRSSAASRAGSRALLSRLCSRGERCRAAISPRCRCRKSARCSMPQKGRDSDPRREQSRFSLRCRGPTQRTQAYLGPHPNGASVKTARMLLSGCNSHSQFQLLRPGRTAALARATSRRRIANQCEVRNFKLKLFFAKGSDLSG